MLLSSMEVIMYEAINPKATLVALNYNFLSTNEFSNKLEEKDIINRYKLKLQDLSWQGQLPPQQIINDIRAMLPYVYKSEDTTIQLTYSQNDFRLSIEKINLNELNFDEFKNLSGDVIDLKLSDISAIGINYTALFNLKGSRLDILNDKITNIPDFDKNLTFEFKLPIFYKERNLVASYRIKKVINGDVPDSEHIYEINVNFHFDIKQLSTGEKTEKLKEILSCNLYTEFLQKSQEFLKLNNGQS